MRPGITPVKWLSDYTGQAGWPQVNGRNAITWEEKFQMDVWYVDNQSFFLDIKIDELDKSRYVPLLSC